MNFHGSQVLSLIRFCIGSMTYEVLLWRHRTTTLVVLGNAVRFLIPLMP